MEGFVAYPGRHSFHGDRVIRHVELSLFPNRDGSDAEELGRLLLEHLRRWDARPAAAGGRAH